MSEVKKPGEILLVSNTENGFYELGERLLALGYIVTGFMLIDERFIYDHVGRELALETLGREERDRKAAKELEIHNALNVVAMGEKVDLIKAVEEKTADVIVTLDRSLVSVISYSEIRKISSTHKARPVIKYVDPAVGTSLALYKDEKRESWVGSREADFFPLLQGFLAPSNKEDDKK